MSKSSTQCEESLFLPLLTGEVLLQSMELPQLVPCGMQLEIPDPLSWKHCELTR